LSLIVDPSKVVELMARKKLLVFDFDGVLADSVGVKTDAFAEMYHHHGDEIKSRVVEHHLEHGGMSRFDKFAYYEAEFIGQPASKERIGELAAQFSDLVVDKVVIANEIPGAERLMTYMASKAQCAVNSATPEQEIRMIIERRGWDHYFAAVHGSPTTKLDNLQKITKKLGVSVDDSLFFGDARSDWLAAKSLGMDFVGVGGVIGSILELECKDYIVLQDFHGLV